jgi:hypothetical protein
MQKLLFTALFLSASISAAALSRDVFPPIKGWQSHKEDMVYTSENLFDLIDGAAEVFLSYGFVDLQVTEYQKEGSQPVRVELYRHNSPLNTFGIYAAERQPAYSFVDIGTQGYIEDGVLNFFIGVYYVKISTDEPKESGRQVMTLVARSVSDFLRQQKGFPDALKLFPVKNKTANAEGYVSENFLGYKCLHSVYTAAYEDTAKIQLFIIPRDSLKGAQAMLGAALKEFGAKIKAGKQTYRVVDPHNGPIYFLQKGSTICGVTHCSGSTKADAYLRQLEQSLSKGEQ